MQTSQQHTRKPNKTQSTRQTVKQKDIAENFDLAWNTSACIQTDLSNTKGPQRKLPEQPDLQIN